MMDDIGATREYLAGPVLLDWEIYTLSDEYVQQQFEWLGTYEGMGAVLAAMRERGWDVVMDTVPGIKEWSAGFFAREKQRSYKEADSLPDAVALAAAAALKGEG